MEKTRIDKWLWAVRIFKTRNQAAEACKKGFVRINELKVKPSREISAGETILVKRPPIIRSYKVLAIAEKRMTAKLVIDFMKDITSQEQLDLLNTTQKRGYEYRIKGLGRPTKHQRRMIEKLKGKQP